MSIYISSVTLVASEGRGKHSVLGFSHDLRNNIVFGVGVDGNALVRLGSL